MSIFGLAEEDHLILRQLLDKYAPGRSVWAFGSRVRGSHRPFSDLDLVILGDMPLDSQTRADLSLALSESNLTVKVDLVEWSRLDPAFRELIEMEHDVYKQA